mgnify:CR=1 FL=1
MQKGKTSKFVPKLGLVLWMLPLSSWAVSGTIPEANSALTSYAHEAREIDAIAQSAKKRTVTGTITDASDGTPIIGANIVVKGSQTGVISDLDGNYSIEVSSKDVLVISFIGYKTREVPVVDLGVINVKLKSDNEMLDEVVVVDLVVGVPESGNAAALGYSLESGIPYGTAFVKNGYVGRTFIKPKQSQRESSVRVKLNVLKDAVAGKRVIMIDDSIVRGTTSDRIVSMLKEAGAKEVHVRISSPPFLYPCYFGTDVPDSDQLIAYNRTVEEIRQVIGADSLGYLDCSRLRQMAGDLPICTGCFTGNYPLDPPMEDIRGEFEQ